MLSQFGVMVSLVLKTKTLNLIISYLSFVSCTKEESSVEIIEEKEINLQMIDAYQEGMNALKSDDGLTAAKKFSEAELLFPKSIWAPRSALMAAYSYYNDEYFFSYQTAKILNTLF